MQRPDQWRVSLETVEPGWLLVPTSMDDQAQTTWVTERTAELRTMWGEEWQPGYDEAVTGLLTAAAQERTSSDAALLFQVWPVAAPIAVMCRVGVLENNGLPPWGEWLGVAHRIEAPNIGPGVQYTHQRTHTGDDQETVEVFSMAYVFDDGESVLVAALQESPALILNELQQGFVGLLDSLRLEAADGTVFNSKEPAGILDDGPWPLESV